MIKFKSQAFHIKYWKSSGSGNPPFLIPALRKIAILGLKTGLWEWYTGISVQPICGSSTGPKADMCKFESIMVRYFAVETCVDKDHPAHLVPTSLLISCREQQEKKREFLNFHTLLKLRRLYLCDYNYLLKMLVLAPLGQSKLHAWLTTAKLKNLLREHINCSLMNFQVLFQWLIMSADFY